MHQEATAHFVGAYHSKLCVNRGSLGGRQRIQKSCRTLRAKAINALTDLGLLSCKQFFQGSLRFNVSPTRLGCDVPQTSRVDNSRDRRGQGRTVRMICRAKQRSSGVRRGLTGTGIASQPLFDRHKWFSSSSLSPEKVVPTLLAEQVSDFADLLD